MFYKKIVIFIFLLFLSLGAYSQPGAEIGVIAGGSYYIGEYNTNHFKNMTSFKGGFYRINFNNRYALRMTCISGDIDIKDKKWSTPDPLPTSFSTDVLEVSGVVEFNFRSFLVPKTKKSSLYSPYIFVGAGMLSANDKMNAVIPFGVGVKVNIWRQLSAGVEWNGRKMFTDRLDLLEDVWQTGETNFFNKDWFFTFGCTLSYRFPIPDNCNWFDEL
ncbi:MAG: porin family protein [Culturomica sp.]|jgi:hypothetical protein|nr:porin family protein [Culturomica sp.]